MWGHSKGQIPERTNYKAPGLTYGLTQPSATKYVVKLRTYIHLPAPIP